MFIAHFKFKGYPESFPSVKDLQECLARTQLKPVLAQSLKSTLEARLLHQGATTEDILIAYVSAIRAFSVLDPTGVLLDIACEPIKYFTLRFHFYFTDKFKIKSLL
jgi:anaphase-promoting complex subunit 2